MLRLTARRSDLRIGQADRGEERDSRRKGQIGDAGKNIEQPLNTYSWRFL